MDNSVMQKDDVLTDSIVYSILKKLLDALPFFAFVIDDKHNIVLANKTVVETLGKKMEDIQGSYCPKTIHNHKEPFPECPLEYTIQQNHYVEKDIFDPFYGTWVTSAIYPLNMKTSTGEQLFLHFAFDITKRKYAENEVLEKKALLENIIESLTQPFYVINTHDYTVTLANTAAKFGKLSKNSKCYFLTHGMKKPCMDRNHPCPIKEIKRTRKSTIVEHTHISPDGESKIFEVHGYPLFNDDGEILQIIEYTLDITLRKQAEEKLEKARKDLEIEAKKVAERNTALKVILQNLKDEKDEIHKHILENIHMLVIPNIERLKGTLINENQLELINLCIANMDEIIKPFSGVLLKNTMNLTPSELNIANLVRQGKSSKEIANLLNLSDNTIKAHFRNIRAKLNIKNKKINLRSYLQEQFSH